jgi:hypothetical protein
MLLGTLLSMLQGTLQGTLPGTLQAKRRAERRAVRCVASRQGGSSVGRASGLRGSGVYGVVSDGCGGVASCSPRRHGLGDDDDGPALPCPPLPVAYDIHPPGQGRGSVGAAAASQPQGPPRTSRGSIGGRSTAARGWQVDVLLSRHGRHPACGVRAVCGTRDSGPTSLARAEATRLAASPGPPRGSSMAAALGWPAPKMPHVPHLCTLGSPGTGWPRAGTGRWSAWRGGRWRSSTRAAHTSTLGCRPVCWCPCLRLSGASRATSWRRRGWPQTGPRRPIATMCSARLSGGRC